MDSKSQKIERLVVKALFKLNLNNSRFSEDLKQTGRIAAWQVMESNPSACKSFIVQKITWCMQNWIAKEKLSTDREKRMNPFDLEDLIVDPRTDREFDLIETFCNVDAKTQVAFDTAFKIGRKRERRSYLKSKVNLVANVSTRLVEGLG